MADDRAQVVYAWVVDAIGTIFVSDEALTTAWAVAAGFTGVHFGLRLPTSLPCGVDLRSGMPTDDSATIMVADVDGTLAALFKSAKVGIADLTTTLEPGATAGASLFSKHVGMERIGPAGERRRYSCVPGFNIGLKHLGQVEAFASNVGAVPVSTNPVLWEGRWCALYRVKYVSGAWQALSAAKRVWWGQLRARGEYKRGVWSFSCFGIQSWLGGNLARGNFEDGLRVVPGFAIDDGLGEHIMYAALNIVALDTFLEHHDYGDTSVFANTTYLVGAETYDDVVAAINLFCDDIVADNANGAPFNDNADGNDIFVSTSIGLDGITIKWKRGDTLAEGDPYVDAGDDARLVCQFRLWAHEKVWRALGYDVRLQNEDRDPVENADQYGRFQEVFGMPGYWQGAFFSANAEAMKRFEDGDWDNDTPNHAFSNGGQRRRWPPLYPGGAAMFTGEPGQEFTMITNDPVLLAGSKSRPVMANPEDETAPYTLGDSAGDVNTQALLVLEGPYRRRGDEDQVDAIAGYAFEIERERREGRTVQVVRVSYRKLSDGSVKAGADGYPRFVIQQWYAPRLFGFDFSPLQGTWGCFRNPPPESESITARPLAVWDARDAGDTIAEVLQRVMLTTGTGGGWYSDAGLTTPIYGLGAEEYFFDVGANDSGGTVPKDAEDASLGLGIPSSMVADHEDFEAVQDAALGPELRRCKVAASGVQSARELFTRLLSPTGLAVGLTGGKYGIFDAWAQPNPNETVLTITPEMYAGQARKPETTIPTQGLRNLAAIDKLDIKGRIDPMTKEYEVTTERAATDSGAASRRGQQIKHQINGDYLISTKLPGVTGNNWRGELATRWRRGFDYWAADQTPVTAKLHMEDALDVWPGDAVLLTDTQLVGADGSYGISAAAARVVGRDPNCEKETITLRLIVGPESEWRMYAPSGVVTRYVQNEGGVGYRLLLEDDHFGDRPSGSFDVDGFAEPAYSSEGGQATIECFQLEPGVGMTGGIYGTVSLINSSAGSCYIQLTGALTGATFYRDRWTVVVLRTWSNQVAWPKRWYAPIVKSDYTHSLGTAGFKFVGVL
jgi:hypothetical protein